MISNDSLTPYNIHLSVTEYMFIHVVQMQNLCSSVKLRAMYNGYSSTPGLQIFVQWPLKFILAKDCITNNKKRKIPVESFQLLESVDLYKQKWTIFDQTDKYFKEFSDFIWNKNYGFKISMCNTGYLIGFGL